MHEAQLNETQRAFDKVAADYDGPSGNNRLIQRLRAELWAEVERRCGPPARLLDLGCGTGLDAAHFAEEGYQVLACDWSPEMVARTKQRASSLGLSERLRAENVGIHELERLESEPLDLIYSDLGPLNCVRDLRAVSRECARLLRPGGLLVGSVIGRYCPWELGYYLLKRSPGRALIRFHRGMVPVGLEEETVWTRYFSPREMIRAFQAEFAHVHHRALNLFMVPPYLEDRVEGRAGLVQGLAWLDEKLGDLPILRNAGDHFLIVLKRRS